MTRHQIRTIVAACGLLGLLLAGPVKADIASPFTADNEGWLIVDYPFRAHGTAVLATQPLPFDGAFGLPAGSVRVGDVYGETGIAAPAAYLGDRRASYGGTLSYDIYLRYSDNVNYPAVVLVGDTMSVYYDADSPPVDAWEHRVVPVSETGWKIGGTGVAVTQAEFMSILQTLSGLYIYTEWRTGPDDTNVDNVVLTGPTSAVGDVTGARVVAACFPNPFNPRTTIRFDLPETGRVRLSVHDVAGRLIRTLVDTDLDSGGHDAAWDGCDAAGRAVGSGIYLARVAFGGRVEAVRMVLVR